MEGYIAQILLFAGNFAPRTWAFCQGQIMPISQNTALFSLIGTTYGGNGQTTFQLPDFRGRTPVGTGNGANVNIVLGEVAGTAATTLTTANLPAHQHVLQASTQPGNKTNPSGGLLASNGDPTYLLNGTSVPLGTSSVGMTGGNQPFDSRQPYLGINFVICLQGIFPSRS